MTWLTAGELLHRDTPRHRTGDPARPAQPDDGRSWCGARRGADVVSRRFPRRAALGRATRTHTAWLAGVRAPWRPAGGRARVPPPRCSSATSMASSHRRGGTPTTSVSTSQLRPGASPLRRTARSNTGSSCSTAQVSIDSTVVKPGHLAYLGLGRDELALDVRRAGPGAARRRRAVRVAGADVVELRRPYACARSTTLSGRGTTATNASGTSTRCCRESQRPSHRGGRLNAEAATHGASAASRRRRAAIRHPVQGWKRATMRHRSGTRMLT